MRIRALLCACLVLLASPALADTVSVHLEAHNGYGRIVFKFAAKAPFKLEQTGDGALLTFSDEHELAAPSGTAPNIVVVRGGRGTAKILLAPGAWFHATQLGSRLLMDVRAAGEEAKSPPKPSRAASPLPASPTGLGSRSPTARMLPPAPVADPPVSDLPVPDLPVPDLPVPDPLVTVIQAPLAPSASTAQVLAAAPAEPAPAQPIAIAAAPITSPAGDAALLPFGPAVGAAAFRHGEEAWVVFDEKRPLDLAALSANPAFAGATVQLLPAGTLLRFALSKTGRVQLDRKPTGWAVTLASGPSTAEPLGPQAETSRLLLEVASPGQVVVAPDPDTGGNLLIGTLRGGPQALRGVPVAYRVPEFNVLPSWQGAVVEPVSDRTVLRVVQAGFAIETGSPISTPPDSARALEAAAFLTRRFDFPSEPPAGLLRRLQVQVAAESDVPAQARLAPRKAAVQTMLALGLAAEAQAVLGLAVMEDPRGVTDPDTQGLIAVAALLSGRPDEADGLSAGSPVADSLTGSDEIALWRAVRTATLQPGSAEAAPVFAATMGLLLSYPDALRDRLLPLAAETMAAGGAGSAADALLAKLPDLPSLAFARAMRLEAKGQTATALAAYDALAGGRDRLASSKAATKATMLRLATHALSPAEAADQFERGFLDWRGDQRELDLRLRVADLRGQAGQWKRAFALLRETAPLYPAEAAELQQHTATLLDTLLRGPSGATIPPLDLVTLAEDNAEAVAKTDPAAMAALVADKLTALDLPSRAGPVIDRMIAAASPGPGQAGLGLRLAALKLGEGDAEGAAAALAETAAPDLPPGLAEQRGLLDARIHARAHDPAGAAAILAALDSEAADDLRGETLAEAGDWHGAAAALASLAGRRIPPAGPLDASQQDIALRLASALSHAGDTVQLHALGEQDGGRIAGPKGDMFRLLTATPVSGIADLRRAGGELAMARAIPAALAAMGSKQN